MGNQNQITCEPNAVTTNGVTKSTTVLSSWTSVGMHRKKAALQGGQYDGGD